jgi:hypothetical protein
MLMLRTPFPCGSSVPQVAKAIYLVQISINYKIWLANDKKESDCGQRVIDPPDVGEKIVALIDSRCGRLLHRHVSAWMRVLLRPPRFRGAKSCKSRHSVWTSQSPVFQVHGADAEGNVVVRRQLKRRSPRRVEAATTGGGRDVVKAATRAVRL